MKKIISCLAFSFILNSCITTNCRLSENNIWKKMGLPPGTVQINDNLFIDQTEVRNIDYLEFLYWTRKVVGETSEKYIELLPDSTVCNVLKYHRNYFKDKNFRESAVVGISYTQAKRFCKWRSDRVMEFMLIREDFLEYNSNQNKDNYFTIEKYINGDFFARGKPVFESLYYPEYDLPDSLAFVNAFKKNAIINSQLNKRRRKKYALYDERLENNPNENSKIRDKLIKKGTIINLKGNVSELTSDSTIVFGMSFKDSCSKSTREIVFNKSIKPNYYKGFRCMCRYKKWGK